MAKTDKSLELEMLATSLDKKIYSYISKYQQHMKIRLKHTSLKIILEIGSIK